MLNVEKHNGGNVFCIMHPKAVPCGFFAARRCIWRAGIAAGIAAGVAADVAADVAAGGANGRGGQALKKKNRFSKIAVSVGYANI